MVTWGAPSSLDDDESLSIDDDLFDTDDADEHEDLEDATKDAP